MKTIASSLVAVAVLLAGCSTIGSSVQSGIPFLEPGVALAVTGYLTIDSSNHLADVAALRKVAAAIDSAPAGTVTDMAWLKQVLAQYFPDQTKYIVLGGAILDVAATLVPQLQGDSPLLQQAMHAIAAGISDATNLYTRRGISKDKIEGQRESWAKQYAKRPALMKHATSYVP
jgi:hypothetical protein